MGDEAAQLLTRYAALLGDQGRADRVALKAVGSDGEEVAGTFVLNSGTVLMAESTHWTLPEPDNAEAVASLHRRSCPRGHP